MSALITLIWFAVGSVIGLYLAIKWYYDWNPEAKRLKREVKVWHNYLAECEWKNRIYALKNTGSYPQVIHNSVSEGNEA